MGSHDYVLSNGLSMMKRSEIKSYETWNAEELAGFISNQGLESYSHTIIDHKITGKLAPLLSEMDLKEMGITCIGDRLRFRLIVDNLKIKKRSLKRTQIVWEGRERIYYSEVTASICTCFGCCPEDPSTYALMSNHIKIKSVNPTRIGPIRLCCCNEYATNNVDLTYVADVDVRGIPAPCCERIICCAPGKDVVNIEIRGYGGRDIQNYKLILQEDEGDKVAGIILNGVEESQRMERN